MRATLGNRLLALSILMVGCGRGEATEGGAVVPPSVGPAGFAGGGFLGGGAFLGDGGVEPVRLRELRTAAKTPPPISGGTLAVDTGGQKAVAADSDRDLIYIVDVVNGGVRRVLLPAGSEPGRVALDASKGAHVALRGSGKLVRIDLESATVVAETAVCSHPRGVAFDPAHESVVVACLEGELVTLDAATHAETERKQGLQEDLRDVLVGAGGVESVTRYRSAQLLRLNADHSVKSSVSARKRARRNPGPFLVGQDGTTTMPAELSLSPALAWRTQRSADGHVWMFHQQSQDDEIPLSEGGGYGSGGCMTITGGQVTEFDAEGIQLRSMVVPLIGLSVDAALSPNGKWLALASPGGYVTSSGTLHVYATERMQPTASIDDCQTPMQTGGQENQTVAVAFDDNNVLYAFSREPAELQVFAEPALPASIQSRPLPPIFGALGGQLTRKASIPLDFASMRDTGHDLFHADVGRGLACASCHGEALDDAHVWTFEKIGPRRTQNMRGGILATAPFHWDGDMMNITHLVDEVMTRRMGGFPVQAAFSSALGTWIDRQPAVTLPASDAAAAERGKVLFASASTQCATCHNPKALPAENKDVGTGGAFQVPSLAGLAMRAPYMHNGCAKTLEQRFEPSCGGGDKHGTTSRLKPNELADLIAYLKTL